MVATLLKKYEHRGMCDASASVALDSNHFVVANDEDSFLRVYKSRASGGPVGEPVPLHGMLGLSDSAEESEIEAAAELGGVTYWISSHSRNKSGKLKLDRHHFLATKLQWDREELTVTPVGSTYQKLLRHLLNRTELADFTRESLQEEKIASLAPKQPGAVNIEGLCRYEEGLLIGFRNPIPDEKALLIPFLNPLNVAKDDDAPKFGSAILLDLDGLGVRSVEYIPRTKSFLIVGGSYSAGDTFHLYSWSGDAKDKPKLLTEFEDFNPESVISFPKEDEVLVLNDDGTRKVDDDGTCCKDLPEDHRRKHFQSCWVRIN
jgi:hypothetical protein